MQEPDDQIQPASPSLQSPHSCEQSEMSRIARAIGKTAGVPHLLPGMLFGGLAGLALGALAGEACCWLSGQDQRLLSGALIGAGLGSIAGILMGIVERTIRGALVRPDIATLIGIVLGLSPALIAAIFMNNGYGLLSGAALLEALVGGPILGLLIGGVLDRAYEASRKQAWGSGLTGALLGLALCVGAGWFMVWQPLGPDPNELAKTAQSLMLSKLRENPHVHEASIEQVTLVRQAGTHYTGIVEATINGGPQRFSLTVIVAGTTVGVTWEPTDD